VYDYSRGVLVLVPNAAFDTPFPPRRTFGATLLSKGPDYTVFEVSGIRKGSPAEAAGLQKGDVVDSLDTKPAATLRLVELRAALADEDSQHVLSITRGAASEKLRIPITIKLVSIEE
jgi:S1-C subfamily serine protease